MVDPMKIIPLTDTFRYHPISEIPNASKYSIPACRHHVAAITAMPISRLAVISLRLGARIGGGFVCSEAS